MVIPPLLDLDDRVQLPFKYYGLLGLPADDNHVVEHVLAVVGGETKQTVGRYFDDADHSRQMVNPKHLALVLFPSDPLLFR